MTVNEQALVRQAQAGDDAAFSELVRQYSKDAYRAAYVILQNQSEAEDIVQEAFLTCFRKLTGFRQESAFRTWLYRVVANLSYDLLRKKRREGALLEKISAGGTAVAYCGSRDLEESMEVREALASLGTGQRAVLTLYYGLDLDVKTVAGILKIPAGTVKSRLAAARAMLKVRLERGKTYAL
ncbi:MAG: RNA polymerase sigma factor [Eubacteriales bacterium]